MAKIVISGRPYELRMNVWAMGEIEKEYGDTREALSRFRKERSVQMVKTMFRILAMAGEKHAGRKPEIPEDVLDECNVADMQRIAAAMNQTMDEAMHAETVGGNEADDSVVDVYAQQLENQEKNV